MLCPCDAAGPEFTRSDAASRSSASDIRAFQPGEQDLLLAVVVEFLLREKRMTVLDKDDRPLRLFLHSVHVRTPGFEPVDPPGNTSPVRSPASSAGTDSASPFWPLR